MISRRAVTLLGMLALTTAHAATYTYTAFLEVPVPKASKTVAANITWQCEKNRCVTKGPWPTPGVGACAALAKQLGNKITSYGHDKQRLSSAQLAQCNQDASSVDVKKPGIYPGLRTLPPGSILVTPKQPAATPSQGSAPPPQQPAPRQATPATPSTGGQPTTASRGPPFRFRSDALVVTGTGALPARGTFAPKHFRSDALLVTGTGSVPTHGPFSPRSFRTDALTVTGTGVLR